MVHIMLIIHRVDSMQRNACQSSTSTTTTKKDNNKNIQIKQNTRTTDITVTIFRANKIDFVYIRKNIVIYNLNKLKAQTVEQHTT